jgi:hypothetical protein
MNPERITILCAPLMLLKFFPSDAQARASVILLIAEMATNEDQVRWLVQRLLDLYDEWPGPRTLRAVFCHKYKPADGKDLRTAICPGYPEGLPSEKPEQPLLPLPLGHTVSADPEIEAMVEAAVQLSPKMPPAIPLPRDAEFRRQLEEALTAPSDREAVIPAMPKPKSVPPVDESGRFAGAEFLPFKRITQADIDRAVAELHARKRQ